MVVDATEVDSTFKEWTKTHNCDSFKKELIHSYKTLNQRLLDVLDFHDEFLIKFDSELYKIFFDDNEFKKFMEGIRQ